MYELSSYDIKLDLIKEIKDYLPTLMELNQKIQSNTAKEGHLKNFCHLVETIRGASSLVKLDSVSKIASALQSAGKEMIAGRLLMNNSTFDAIDTALTYLDEYALDEDGSELESKIVFSDVIARLDKLHKRDPTAHGIDPLLELSSSQVEDEDDLEMFEGIPTDDEDEFAEPDLTADMHSISEVEEREPLADPGFADALDHLSCLENREDLEGDSYDKSPLPDGEDDWDAIDLPEEELLEGFYQEAEDHFHNLGNALAQLESEISRPTTLTPDHKELLRLIRRAVHTIKGAAAVIRLSDIAAWGHDFEDLLDWLYERAEQIEPKTLNVVADAADLLERLVSSPQEIDSDKQLELRGEFERIIGEGFSDIRGMADVQPTYPLPLEPSEEYFTFEETPERDFSLKETTFPTSVSKTLRVEMGKIESLVNLASELIIALSGFDENMNNLATIIGELDRSRLRLKTTARDLESGYELKAIRNLNLVQHQPKNAQPMNAQNFMGEEFMDFDLLELDRYSEFNLLIRSLNETAVDVNTIGTQLSHVHRGFKSYFNRLRILLSELQEKVMRVRMTPMSSILNRLRSTVRETAATLQKNVRLAVAGEEIELDKRIWETLADPLMHLLRNAVDHGIEVPDIREAAGKPDLATIQLTATYQGNQVIIRVIDDGAGLDFSAIRKRAEELNLDTAEKNDIELAQFIFHQGFSTRQDVSEISGRGVGMDVVQENIANLNGTVKIERTEPGTGTSFLIRIPLTLAVMRALIFEVNGRLYATALYDIQEILRIHPRDLKFYQGRAVQIGNRILPFYKMSESLPKGLSELKPSNTEERMLVIVINTGTWQGAVAIDRMHTQKEIVVKSLGSHLQHVRGVSGATIMGDGKVIPILNLEELLRAGPVRFPKVYSSHEEVTHKPLEILIVDDSVSVRMVISRLMQRQGWRVQTAKDGVEAVEILHQYRPDLVVLDVEMPRMNGYEFMRTFRSQDNFANIPVIMLTSRSAQKHRDKADDLGVNAFLVKPYEDSSFIELVKKLTNHSMILSQGRK